MASIFSIKQGDTRPYLRATLRDGNGNAINLSTATGVVFYMRRTFLVPAQVNGVACVIIDAVGGVVEYQWAVGDTDIAGDFMADFRITYAGDESLSVPSSTYMTVKVLKKLG